ncbi:signal peptidase I [Photobacterium damselae]|uniref:signal peptidase I n=1 Tax=Photobacterium damselae TaxID=38293 RepID=UPI00406849FA
MAKNKKFLQSDNFKSILILIIIIVAKLMFINWYSIPSGSMIPTLSIGDHVLVNKNEYNLTLPFTEISLIHHKNPEAGDVVVFNERASGTTFIKRIIGVGGDTVLISGKDVFVNGKILKKVQYKEDDNFVYYRETNGNGVSYNVRYSKTVDMLFKHANKNYFRHIKPLRTGSWKVPKGTVFVMGDNRDNSEDSRFLNEHYIELKQVFGKAIAIPLGFRKFENGLFGNLMIKPVIPDSQLYLKH